METIYQRVGALDVHKAQVTACVRVPDAVGRREPHLAEFSTTVAGLMALRDWLAAHRVTHVAMEATGVYWQPVWHILEDDFELTLCNARHVKQVPGRKTDISDGQWLCQLMEAGLLRGSFVPPKPQRQLRTLTRYRKTQIAERQREANRLHKALEDTGIKLERIPHRRTPRVLGRTLPRQRPIRRQTPLRTNPQRLEVARDRARRSRPRRDPHQEHLSRRAIPTTPPQDRTRPRARRRQTLHARCLLAHVHHRRDLPRTRRQLLPNPGSRTHHQTPHRQTPRTRTRRHPRTSRCLTRRLFLIRRSRGRAEAAGGTFRTIDGGTTTSARRLRVTRGPSVAGIEQEADALRKEIAGLRDRFRSAHDLPAAAEERKAKRLSRPLDGL